MPGSEPASGFDCMCLHGGAHKVAAPLLKSTHSHSPTPTPTTPPHPSPDAEERLLEQERAAAGGVVEVADLKTELRTAEMARQDVQVRGAGYFIG